MALFNWFKPKWKSTDPDVRLAAVQAMGVSEIPILRTLAATDGDARVRLAAVERIGDREALEDLLGATLPPQVRQAVRAKVELFRFQTVLDASRPLEAETALARVEDSSLLERLAAEAPTPSLRVKAVERLTDPDALCRVLEKNCGKEAARAALTRIDDEALLVRLARSGASKVSRRLAEEKLAARAAEREEPARQALRDRELERLVEAAGELSSTRDPGTAAGRLASLRLAWDRLDADRAHPRWPAFLAAARRFEESREEAPAPRAEEVPETGADANSAAAEEARAAAEAAEEERRRLDALAEDVRRAEALLGADDPAGAATALAEVDRLLREGSFHAADPSALRAQVASAQRRCQERLAARSRADATARAEQLCADLEGLAEAEDRAEAARRLRVVQRAWRNLPALPQPEAGALGERFRAAETRFGSRQVGFEQQQEWLRWNNKTLKEALCTEAEALDAEEDLPSLAGKVKELQRRWKDVGPVPQADAAALWEHFQAACDRNFERCRPHFEELDRLRAEAGERREALCSEAESHGDSTAWKESAEALKSLQAQWNDAGPPPRKGDELSARFRRACDRFFERRKAHFAELDEARRSAQAEKERLCERAEALAAEPDRSRIREVRALQTAWKAAGPAPRDAEQPLWERFRGAADRFFAGLDGDREENLRRKEALCAEVEALSATGSQEAAAAIPECQRRWVEIGPVPMDRAEELWDRFQALCDACLSSTPARSAPAEAAEAAATKGADTVPG